MALLDNLMMGAPASAGFPIDPGALAEQQAAQEARDVAAARMMRRRVPPFGADAAPPIGMLEQMPGMAMATAPGAAPTMPTGGPSDMAAMFGGTPAAGGPAVAPAIDAPAPAMAPPVPATPSATPEWLRLMTQAPLSNPSPPAADSAALPATSAPAAGTGEPVVPPASLL